MIIEGNVFVTEINSQDDLNRYMNGVFHGLRSLEHFPDESLLKNVIATFSHSQADAPDTSGKLTVSTNKIEQDGTPSPHARENRMLPSLFTGRTHDFKLDTPEILAGLRELLEKDLADGLIKNFQASFHILKSVPAYKEIFADVQREQGLFVLDSRAIAPGYQHHSSILIETGPTRETKLWVNASVHPLNARTAKGLPDHIITALMQHVRAMEYESNISWLNDLVPDNAEEILNMFRSLKPQGTPEIKRDQMARIEA